MQAHALSAVLPGGECEFAGQLKQEPTAEAARVVEYVPAPQSRHVEAPVIILYFPASHAAHIPPSGPVYPGLHRQLVRRLLPLGESECSGQLSHTSTSAEPKTALYVPAPQSIQLPAAEAPVLVRYLPAPQLVQVLSKEAPAAVEYLPLPQSVQGSLPCVALYPPASHAAHVPPSGPVYPGSHRQLAVHALCGHALPRGGVRACVRGGAAEAAAAGAAGARERALEQREREHLHEPHARVEPGQRVGGRRARARARRRRSRRTPK
jgi:hypothetical protein